MSARDLVCIVCGDEGPHIRKRLTWYDPPLPTATVTYTERCLDDVGCKQRIEAAGEDWPLRPIRPWQAAKGSPL